MADQLPSKENGDKIPRKKSPEKGTIKEKVHKHISDINDVITGEDIRDAKIDTGELEEAIEEKEALLENDVDDNDANKKPVQKDDLKSGAAWEVLE